jgi:hypothetical protein
VGCHLSAYPANVAYVSYGGTTWKSVGESLNIAPGTDVAKWMRWGFTAAELNDSLGNAVAAHEAKVNPHPQYVTDAALEAHAAYPAAHVNYVRHDAAQGLTNSQATQARTNIGAEATGVAATEVQKGSARYSADTGAANAAVVSYAPAITVLTDGMVLLFAAAATNTGATTLNVNGLGAKPVLGEAQAPLQGGEIVANGKCTVVWHATLNSFVLIGCTGAGAASRPGHQARTRHPAWTGYRSLVADAGVCPAGRRAKRHRRRRGANNGWRWNVHPIGRAELHRCRGAGSWLGRRWRHGRRGRQRVVGRTGLLG